MFDMGSSPDFFEQLPVSNHESGVAYQFTEQVEFDGCQTNLLRTYENPAPGQFYFQFAGLEKLPGSAGYFGNTPEQRFYAGQKYDSAERLGEVIVGTVVQRLGNFTFLITRGEHDDRHFGPLTQATDHFLSIDIR